MLQPLDPVYHGGVFMDFKFGKETTDGEAPARTQEKGKQTGMLVLLLLLLGGFGYLYFFTGLIRPQEQPSPPPLPQQVVKQPLPSRDAAAPSAPASAEPVAKAPQKPAETKAAAPVVKPVEKKPESAKPAAKQEPAKVAAAPVAKKPEPAKPVAAAAKAEPKKVVAAKVEEPKAAADTKKQAELVKKQAEPARKQVVSKTQGPWTVVVGLYVVEETLAEDISKVKKTGLTPVMTSGPKRPVTMNRLFYGEYASKEEAQQAVAQLRRTAGGGFSMQRGEKHEVYAGSYAVLSGAQSEQQRLAASGVKVTIKKTQVPLASRKLTAGTFTDRTAAAEAVKKLKAAGIGTPTLE
jgi:DNA polymerase III gamma/tau subunit